MKFFYCLILFVQVSFGQNVYRGRVTDANTGDPVPFAAVGLKGKAVGTNTDFDGYYTLRTTQTSDSLVVSYLGYNKKSRAIQAEITEQTIDFQLLPSASQLAEVRVYAKGENPAYKIIRQVVARKEKYDPKRLDAYQFESYVKNEIDVNQVSDDFKKSRLGKKIASSLEKYEQIAGEDGKPIIPIFFSENLSTFYRRQNPYLTKEIITKSRIDGVGVTDGSLFSQFIGNSFQQYDFNENWLRILQKDFISPIADGWKTSYEYFLADTVDVDDRLCYEIEIDPKREQDLAFRGKIWIDTATYALRQLDLKIAGEANINYVDAIRIQQTLVPVQGDTIIGAWLPNQTRVLIDVRAIGAKSPGMLVKFSVSNKNFVINNPKEPKFYDPAIELAEGSREPDDAFWAKNRHDSLTRDDKLAYSLIDSVKNIPIVRTYTEVLTLIANGYKRVYTGVELGPFLSSVALNNVEGLRLRVGLRTNAEFSKVWVMKGYLAYGTKDGIFKYGANIKYILSRKPWLEAGVNTSYDLERIGLTSEAVGDNSLFAAYARFGTYRRGYFQREHTAYFRGEIIKGVTPMIGIRRRTFDPLYVFAYNRDGNPGSLASTFSNTELITEIRIAKNELFIYNENDRISLGTEKAPIFTFRYAFGLKNTLGGDFNYHRFSMNMAGNFRVGILGRSNYDISGGYTPSTLPYPLLFPHLGNQTPFYVGNTYNLMNWFEFLSDRFASIRYEHNFEGLLFNRVPLIKKLKWRSLVNLNVLYGGARQANRDIIPDFDSNGVAIPCFGALNPNIPYVEVGYGVENILKFFRVQAVHRLTYLGEPSTPDGSPINRFGIKFSAYFTL